MTSNGKEEFDLKFFNGFKKRQGSETQSPGPLLDISTKADVEENDEITEEALLEAIVGTGNPDCQNTGSAGRSPNASIGQNRHKHR